ncbi:Ig-like domain-containing protein [Buttiauxella sp. WJP83]|uniref:Ig-like domain-containing protein n=1 Tax=Buttiauxella sp. WJP83 TaxID=2986951 RepID=UPI0022DDAA52|nr:Ig-like domain-containing protein [Buttiauxella sp. WJP83]WBM71596.1 Ig-like domain-containing protein [Buttiauxella sp. WJP83]
MATQNNLPGSVRITGFDNGEQISQFSGGSDRVVNLTKPSIVRVQASPENVNYYERQGDDLIVHMKDGSTVRYQHFFTLDANGHHSELYFDDLAGSHHAIFPSANEAGPATAQTVVPTYAESPVVAAAGEDGNNNALLWIGAGLLAAGGIALAAGGGGGGGGGGGDNNNNGNSNGGSDPAAQPKVSTLTLNPFAGDNVVSAVETLESQTVSGSTQAFNAGRTISITIDGQTWTGTVNSDGSWSISIPTSTLQQLAVGTHTMTVTMVDVNGVTLTQSQDFTVDLTVPAPTIDTPFGDGFLNLAEQGQNQTITGKTGITGPGQAVVLEFNGQSYTATVDENGNWQVTIPASALQAVPDGVAQMTVTVVDANGNTAEQSVDVTVDTVPPALLISDIGNNGIIDGLMVNSGQDQIVRGTSDAKEVGDKVTVTFNGKTYETTVDQNGNWQVNIPVADLAGKEGSNNVSAVITDPAGNTTAASKDFSLTSSVITINNFAGDNVLDGAEMQINQILSGTTQNIPVGTTVVINFAGTTFNALVETGGVWHLDLTPAQLALTDGSYTISVTVPGYVITAVSESFTVNTTQPAIAIAIISTDDVLNATEIQQPITISGVTTLLGAGVIVTFNGKTYPVTADGEGKWSTQIPAEDLAGLKDGPFDVQAQATLGGQTANVSHTFVVDTTAPVITFDAVTADNIVNAAEAGAALTITGKISPLDANFIHQVTVTINGKSFTGNVHSDGTWSVQADANVLNGVQDGNVTIQASVNDAAGNTGSASHLLTLDTTPPILTVDSDFLQDGKLNFSESQVAQILSGQSDAGAKVSLVINGKTIQTLADGSGHWSMMLPSGDLKTLNQGVNTLDLTATDVAGNSFKGSVSIDVKTTGLPTLAFDTLFGDGAVNAFEALGGGLITGTAHNLPLGAVVTVVIGSSPDTVTATGEVDASGHWSATVSPNDMKILSDGLCSVIVTASDAYGNVGTASGSMDILIHQQPHAVLTTPLFVDGSLNLAEAQAGQALTGNSGIIGSGQFVSVLINGKTTVKGVVDSNGNWTVHLPPNVLLALADGTNTIRVMLTDRASNLGVSPDYSFQVSTLVLPLSALDTLVGVGALSYNETQAVGGQVIADSTGTSAEGQSVQTMLNGGLGGDIISTTPPVAPMMMTASMSESNTTGDETSTTHSTSTTSSNTTEPTEHLADTSGDAAAYTIGGLSIDLADGTTVSGDTLHGSTGNDIVHLSTLGFVQIDGGAGTDTLVLDGVNMTLDLVAEGSKIQHIEIFDLGLSGTNSITLNLNEALNITDKPEDDLLIKGAKGDQVNLVHGTGDVWEVAGQREINGVEYDVYHNSSQLSSNTLGDVLIQQGLHVNLV